MRIRAAEPADAAAIHDVSVASCHAAYADVLDDDAFLEMVDDPSRVPDLRSRLVDAATAPSVVYLVAENDTGVVGFVQCLYGDHRPAHVDEGAAYLKSLYVRPGRWGEGIGSDLLAAATDRLPDCLERVQLGVLAANDVGRRFYEARGFEKVGDGTFEAGDVTYDTVVYARDR